MFVNVMNAIMSGLNKMGTYGIGIDEFMDGHVHVTRNKETDHYGFEEFLMDFEGDVCAETVAEAWNKLAKKYDWLENLQVINKYSKKPIKD